MAREERIVNDDVEIYKHFGWRFLEDRWIKRKEFTGSEYIHRPVRHYVLVRDTEMPNHAILKAYEDKYFYLKGQKKYYEKTDIGLAICFFCIFIVPGVIYIIYKILNKHYIEKCNKKIQEKMDLVLQEADELL